jgi:hypothetical protein
MNLWKFSRWSFSILAFTLSFGLNNLYAQVGVRISYEKPSGELGYLVKPTMLTEIYYEGYTDYLFKYGGSIGYAPLQTNLDTVPIGTIYMGDSTVLLPSWAIYSKMRQYSLGFNMEYKILDRRLSPVVGTDVYFHILEYDLEYVVPNERHTYSDELVVTMGILPRISVCFNITDDLILHGGIGQSMAIDYQWNKFLYWKIFCGIKYYFQD